MGWANAKERARLRTRSKARQWYTDLKRLEAQAAATRAKIRVLQASGEATGLVAGLPVLGRPVGLAHELVDSYRFDAELELKRVERRVRVARARINSAKAAQRMVVRVRPSSRRGTPTPQRQPRNPHTDHPATGAPAAR